MYATSFTASSFAMVWNHAGGSHLLAKVSVNEIVHKEHQRELDRIVQDSADVRSVDYGTYVILPMFLLICAMIAIRKFFTI